MKIRSFGNTDLGRMRRRNEDAFLDDPEHRLFAVADGLGGLSAGDRASQLAITILKAHLQEALKNEKQIDFPRMFEDGHQAIQKLGAQANPAHGSGSTLTAALLNEDEALIAHAGDSAAYIFSKSEWKKLTTDHTEAEVYRQLRPGELVPSIYEHTLTRCLGQPDPLDPDLLSAKLKPGDCLFLCTDGVTREISPDELHAWSREAEDPQPLVEKALLLARRRGGADNATAVAVFIDRFYFRNAI